MSAPLAFDLPVSAPTSVEPTVRNRVHTYDFLRGIAILGILIANIPAFASPAFSEMLTMAGQSAGIDGQVDQWITVFVTGKFRSMLAILFGVGLWLQYAKRSQVEGNWPGGYMKRTLFLALFGVIHGIFIWWGDILFLYACVAFVACLLVSFDEKVIRWIIGVAGGLALFGAFLLLGLSFADFDLGKMDEGMPFTAKEELAAFSQGSYLDQLSIRGIIFGIMAVNLLFLQPVIGALFLLGSLLARHGVLVAPSKHPKVRNLMLLIGFGIGLPLNALCGYLAVGKQAMLVEQAVEVAFGALLTMGYVMLLAIAAERGWLRSLQNGIANVGRMAFSNYILQSLICTAVFYSWGGGLFGKLDRLEQLGVVVGVWVVNFVFSYLWLRHFQMGPLEWLWRSLTEGRRMPIRREASA